MSEWWTYRPSDFLLFSSRTYNRLFELYNADIWPLQILALVSGVAILALLRSRIAWRGRLITVILVCCWLWVAWAFHWQRYATINWAATYFAAAFAIEAVLLMWIGVVRDRFRVDSIRTTRVRWGIAIFCFALLVQPFLGLLLGRSWLGLEFFGVTPDPTAMATLGLLLMSHQKSWLAWPIPVLWCLISATTLGVLMQTG